MYASVVIYRNRRVLRTKRRQPRGSQDPGLPPQGSEAPLTAAMAAAGGSSNCPPPPPPPPPNNNNNNNTPKSPGVPDAEDDDERRHDELPEDINNFDEDMNRQFENMNLLDQVELLAQSYSLLDHLDDFDDDDEDDDFDPEPDQDELPEYSDDDDLELQGAAAAPIPNFFSDDDCLEDLPEKFDGNPDMLGPFMYQCQLFMEKSTRDFSDFIHL